MRSPSVRFAAGTLVLALPLSAATGCAVQKKRTIKAEFASATKYLQASKASSFTLRLDDGSKSLEKLMTKKGDLKPELAQAVTGGSITVTVAGKSLSRKALTRSGDLAATLKDVSMSVVVRDNKAELGELRLVQGVLYGHVGLNEISRLAALGGTTDLDSTLDQGVQDGPPEAAALLTDVRAGKWVKLDLTKYVDKLAQLTEGLTGIARPTPSAAAFDAQRLGNDLITAVKPYVTVTDANDSSSDRVLDVTVKARPALKAALTVLQGAKDLPFPNPFVDVLPADVDDAVKDGTARGQIRLKDGHLRSFSLDVESLRQLAKDPGTDSLAGLNVALDIDDSADALVAPDNVSSVDVGKLVDSLFENLQGSTGAGGSYSG